MVVASLLLDAVDPGYPPALVTEAAAAEILLLDSHRAVGLAVMKREAGPETFEVELDAADSKCEEGIAMGQEPATPVLSRRSG